MGTLAMAKVPLLFKPPHIWRPSGFAMTKGRSEERRVGKECRSLCDWSSDVCSSDLGIITVNYGYARYGKGPSPVQTAAHLAAQWVRYDQGKIGRASCRERV